MQAAPHPAAPAQASPSHLALFAAFLKVGLLGFGGVAAWVRRILIEERGWLEEREFVELLGVSSVLPGANTVNLSILVGDRFQGTTGALAALGGLLGPPLVLLAMIATLYDRFSSLAPVRAGLAGAAAAAAGLVLGQALKMLRNAKPDVAMIVFTVLTFGAVGLIRMQVLWALVVLIPLSVLTILFVDRAR